MAIEKTIRDKHEYASLQLEGLLHISLPKKPAEYRAKDRHWDPPTGPVLYLGQRCVLRIQNRGIGNSGIIGYLLCRIISWRETESWYSTDTTIYMVPEESSSPKLDDMLGQLTHSHYGVGKYVYGNSIISFDAKDMPPRREAA